VTGTATRRMRSPAPRRHRGRRWTIAIVVVIVLLVVIDFAARAVAESVMASKIKQQGLQHKPSVSIGGFPFLTQVAGRDFKQVSLKAKDQTEGPVTITSMSVTARNITLSSYAFSSGTIGSVNGTVLISFASLGNTLAREIGPLGSLLNGAGLNLTAAGPDEVKASLNLLVTSGSATWRVTRHSSNKLNIRLVRSSGLPSSLLSSIQNKTLTIPKLPLGLRLDSVRVSTAGVIGRVSGTNVPFGS
jgi:hypothetical protein